MTLIMKCGERIFVPSTSINTGKIIAMLLCVLKETYIGKKFKKLNNFSPYKSFSLYITAHRDESGFVSITYHYVNI